MKTENKSSWPITKSGFITALVFGGAAFLVLAADLMIPVYGETIRIDPREIFVTIGSALTGPIGGLIIGFIAQTWFHNSDLSFRIMSAIVHMAGGLWMGVSYKKLIHEKLKMPWLLFGWGGLIVIYYFIMLFFIFPTGSRLLFPDFYSELFGNLPLLQAYWALATSAVSEFILTLVLTTIIIVILPPKYRRPLW